MLRFGCHSNPLPDSDPATLPPFSLLLLVLADRFTAAARAHTLRMRKREAEDCDDVMTNPSILARSSQFLSFLRVAHFIVMIRTTLDAFPCISRTRNLVALLRRITTSDPFNQITSPLSSASMAQTLALMQPSLELRKFCPFLHLAMSIVARSNKS